jgi:hypothetical protein
MILDNSGSQNKQQRERKGRKLWKKLHY